MEKKRFGIPTSVGIALSIIMIILNQLFAFIGGSLFFETIFHVPLYMGVIIMLLFYFAMIFILCYLD